MPPRDSRRPRPEPSDEAVERVAARFRALADPARLRILNALVPGERSVNELAEQLGLEQPTVSRQLGVLRREGIVARRADGNRGFYRIDDASAVELCEAVRRGLAERLAGDLEGLEDASTWRGMDI